MRLTDLADAAQLLRLIQSVPSPKAKAQKTARNAKTFTKLALTKMGWKCLSLDAKSGYEYVGVVDMIAVRRNKKYTDKLHVMLLQVKGGRACDVGQEAFPPYVRRTSVRLCGETT
jgi:hypothetical protein